MRSALEATLIMSLSIFLTLLVMAVVFPVHALGAGEQGLDAPAIQPAVFVHGEHDRPGPAGSTSAQQLDGRNQKAVCPYLAALAAASGCPALEGTDAAGAAAFSSLLISATLARSTSLRPRPALISRVAAFVTVQVF